MSYCSLALQFLNLKSLHVEMDLAISWSLLESLHLAVSWLIMLFT